MSLTKIHASHQGNTLSHQSGFTLIEILVALIILSIGLLGMASLQINGLKSNQSAYLKTQANVLAYDMADRIRANSARAIAGDYDAFTTAGTVPSNPACSTGASGCTAAEQVSTDLFEWNQNINGSGNAIALLPGSVGIITRGPGNQFTITINWSETEWDESAGNRNTATKSYSLNFSL